MYDALEVLNRAAAALFEAADLLSDIRCEQWADAGGVGAPPSDRRIDALYALAEKAEAIREELDQ